MISAKADLLDFKELSRDIEQAAEADLLEKRKELVDQLVAKALDLFRSTTLHWAGGDREPAVTKGYKKTVIGEPIFKSEVITDTDAEYTVRVAPEGPEEGIDLWIRLNRGVKPYKVESEKGEIFQPISTGGQRTIKGTTRVNATTAYSGRLVKMKQGAKIKGFKGRGWTEKIQEQLVTAFKAKFAEIGLTLTVDIQTAGP